MVRAIQKYRDAAMIEIEVLQKLQRKDPDCRLYVVVCRMCIYSCFVSKCIQLLRWFDFSNHICMVFPKYGLSVYDFLKKNDFQPYSMPHVQFMARQILEAVACIIFHCYLYVSFYNALLIRFCFLFCCVRYWLRYVP